MKLPFKIPSIKLPKFKLPKFGKKKADDDEDDEDFEGLGDIGDADGADDTDDKDGGKDDKPAPDSDSDAPAEGGEAPAAEAGDAPDASGGEGAENAPDVPDFGDDDEDEDGEGGDASKKKRLMMIGGGGLAALLIIGGGVWYFMSGDDAEEPNRRAGVDPDIPWVEISVPPKARTGRIGSLNAIAGGATGPGSGVVVAAVSETAFASFATPVTSDAALAVANDPSLIEQSPQGPLPRIAEDGRKPWQVYAKPFTAAAGDRRIGLIVAGLGLSRSATEAAIRLLPGGVTLAFDPYAEGLAEWAAKARQAGHEVLLMVPLESADFPYRDAGPKALTTTNDPEENRFRLEFMLSRMSGYVGVLTTMGSKFAKSDEHLRAFFEEINNRGLIVVDGKREDPILAATLAAEIGLPRASVDVVLDEVPSKSSIDRNFGEVEDIITERAVGVAVAEPYPTSIERIIAWSAALRTKKIALAPMTSIVGRQPVK